MKNQEFETRSPQDVRDEDSMDHEMDHGHGSRNGIRTSKKVGTSEDVEVMWRPVWDQIKPG